MSSTSKQVTYRDPANDPMDYLVPLQYDLRTARAKKSLIARSFFGSFYLLLAAHSLLSRARHPARDRLDLRRPMHRPSIHSDLHDPQRHLRHRSGHRRSGAHLSDSQAGDVVLRRPRRLEPDGHSHSQASVHLSLPLHYRLVHRRAKCSSSKSNYAWH